MIPRSKHSEGTLHFIQFYKDSNLFAVISKPLSWPGYLKPLFTGFTADYANESSNKPSFIIPNILYSHNDNLDYLVHEFNSIIFGKDRLVSCISPIIYDNIESTSDEKTTLFH